MGTHDLKAMPMTQNLFSYVQFLFYHIYFCSVYFALMYNNVVQEQD